LDWVIILGVILVAQRENFAESVGSINFCPSVCVMTFGLDIVD
jgi:hypothetical protein